MGLPVWQGTLALMVLRTVAVLGPQHGYGIAKRIEQVSADTATAFRLKAEATLALMGIVLGPVAYPLYSCACPAGTNGDPDDASVARRTGHARETPGSVRVDAVITTSR